LRGLQSLHNPYKRLLKELESLLPACCHIVTCMACGWTHTGLSSSIKVCRSTMELKNVCGMVPVKFVLGNVSEATD